MSKTVIATIFLLVCVWYVAAELNMKQYALYTKEYNATSPQSMGYVSYYYYKHQMDTQKFLFYIRDNIGTIGDYDGSTDYMFQFSMSNVVRIACYHAGCIEKLRQHNLA